MPLKLIGRHVALLCAAFAAFNLLAAATLAQTPDQQIRSIIVKLGASEPTAVTKSRIVDPEVLRRFYAGRDFAPIWNDQKRLGVLIQGIKDAETHGLTPANYRLEALEAALTGPQDWTAETEITATSALAQLARDLHIGKVDPVSLDPRWNLDKPARRDTAAELLTSLVAADDLLWAIHALPPDHFFYDGLRYALTLYRSYAYAGGWAPIPDEPSLKPGMTDPRVSILRKHLAMTDNADPATPETAALYDDKLAEAVAFFQIRHGLDADGVVGPATRRALNISAQERVDQVRVNLERARWVLHNLGDEFFIVNIAGFDAFLIRNGTPVWTSRVVVGRPYRKTPVFRAEISYMVLNPTWSVPPTIMRKDKLPAIAKDQTYLARNNMDLRDSAGHVIDPDTIDWEAANRNGLPYQIVQRPGPDNALGKIKFMFPNEHFVYLHDTPNRELFDKSVRTFSSGCIRLQNPVDLAERLLEGQENWTRASLDAALATGKSKNVTLAHKIPIIITYWTVQPSPVVGVRFFPDVYDRDDDVLRALNAAR
ncbi:MAG: L,D-transpeptidase family protein [Proteobacteria bacterium]|nr:L,D-transpeptidase family protein [Pseudomonadota bacterium]